MPTADGLHHGLHGERAVARGRLHPAARSIPPEVEGHALRIGKSGSRRGARRDNGRVPGAADGGSQSQVQRLTTIADPTGPPVAPAMGPNLSPASRRPAAIRRWTLDVLPLGIKPVPKAMRYFADKLNVAQRYVVTLQGDDYLERTSGVRFVPASRFLMALI